MKSKLSGSAIPRHYVFVLQDGTAVVQWVDKKVQDILTGKFLNYDRQDFGHWITDGELDHLRQAGRVEHYTPRYVWLNTSPEQAQPGPSVDLPRKASHRVRAFYITTALPESQLDNVRAILPSLNLPQALAPQIHDERVAIYGAGQTLFKSLQDAENVLHELTQLAPQLFQGASVAVYEMALGRQVRVGGDDVDEELSLEKMLASLSDMTLTAGKQVVIVGQHGASEKSQLEAMLVNELEMVVTHCTTGTAAIPTLEDIQPHLVLVDLGLPDMHGWAFIRKVREIRLNNLSIFVFSDNPSDEVFALKVARVSAFLPRPLNMQRLREKIWLVLRATETDPPA